MTAVAVSALVDLRSLSVPQILHFKILREQNLKKAPACCTLLVADGAAQEQQEQPDFVFQIRC